MGRDENGQGGGEMMTYTSNGLLQTKERRGPNGKWDSCSNFFKSAAGSAHKQTRGGAGERDPEEKERRLFGPPLLYGKRRSAKKRAIKGAVSRRK